MAAIDAKSNRLVAEVPVGNGPTNVAVGEGSIWVTNSLDHSVSRIDPRTSRLVQRIDVGGDPSGIAVGAGAVWVANSLDGTVSRIDPQTNREAQVIPVGVTPTALAVGDGRGLGDERAGAQRHEDRRRSRPSGRQDPDRRARSRHRGGRRECVGHGRVESERRPHRCSAGRVVETVGVGNGPTGVAFGGGSRVGRELARRHRLAHRTEHERVTATIPVGEGPDGIAVGSDAVWVSGEFSEAIARIDPAENRVVERVPIANRPKGLALSTTGSGSRSRLRRRPPGGAVGRRSKRVDPGLHRPELHDLGRDELLAERGLRRSRRALRDAAGARAAGPCRTSRSRCR